MSTHSVDINADMDPAQDGWTPWLTDDRVLAITPFALDGNPVEWGHTNWLALDDSGAVLDVYFTLDLKHSDKGVNDGN